MKNTLYPSDCIILDGRMDAPVWDSVETYTDFKEVKIDGQILQEEQTFFKIIPCEDRIYVGIKCMSLDTKKIFTSNADLWNAEGIELFLSPSGNPYDFYQFYVSPKDIKISSYYEEGGNIRPDPYAPEWNYASYIADDYWTSVVELPLTAFYMTTQDRWSSKWLVNVARRHISPTGRYYYSSWSYLEDGFLFPNKFNSLDGFPIRSPKNEFSVSRVSTEINREAEDGFYGIMKVNVNAAYGGEFLFASDHADTTTVMLDRGLNEFSVPCHFDKLGRYRVSISLTRTEDDMVFKRYYPVKISYEPIVVRFTKPEYRTNFYPGQDTTTIEGTVKAALPVILKLEGPGIETQVITPDEDGSFVFATPNFEKGDAFLTATTAEREIVTKIRNLPPSGNMMTWISGGNLMVNGKAVLRRNLYAPYYFGGEALRRKYETDDLHMTMDITEQSGTLASFRVIPGSESMGGEATLDARPSDKMMQHVESVIKNNQGKDFAFYYICDEPECRRISNVYLQYIYDLITDMDPYHVILSASREASSYINIADWFETHPYINPSTDRDGNRAYVRNINTVGKYVDDIVKLNRTDKCIGFLPTCFAGLKGRKEPYPTFEEYLCHTWVGMIHGGKTLWPYAYHDINDRASIYEGTRYVFSSFEALEELILHGKRTVLLQNETIDAALYELGEEKMFVLCNMTGESQQVTLDGISGTWHEFRHDRQITGNTFNLSPLEVLIGTTEVKDADLPTYDETVALIDEIEYRRTHRGSLLFEREGDIEITKSAGSSGLGWCYKMFDGTQDNLAWESRVEGEKYLELNLTKVQPRFNKVVVSGYNVSSMDIRVRVDGELVTPEIAEVQTEEFSTTFLLKDLICPDALRLDFYARTVEIYEIEVFD